MQKSRRWEYLKALRNKRLSPERRLGLRFLDHVRRREFLTIVAGIENVGFAIEPKPGILCLNCDGELPEASLYCDEFCKDSAKFVRYIRACELDGRITQRDIQEAIGIRLLWLDSGGYPESQRTLPEEVRQSIFERDARRCQVCGADATQIDHIEGDSEEPRNLRAICGACNRRRAFQSTEVADADEQQIIQEIWDDFAERIVAPEHLRVCDDPVEWKRRWPKLKADARRARAPY